MVKTNKNHELLISRHNLKILFFLVCIGQANVSELPVIVCHCFFIGFYNVSELLTMKTSVKTSKNHDFLSSRHNLKIMIFFGFYWLCQCF